MFVLVYTQISPAISRPRRTISAGVIDVAETSARAAASAYEPPGDLGLADPGGADEDDVVGGDLLADPLGRALAAPPVAQRDGDGLLRVGLADDVPVELCNDLTRRKVRESRERLLRAGRGHVSSPRAR